VKWSIVLCLCVATMSMTSRAAVRTVLAIGNDVGLADEAPLRWAETDAERLRDVFVEIGGVAAARATLVQAGTVDDVTLELLRIRGQVEEVKRRGERAELVVTFSGHGDDDSLHLMGERMPIARLQALLRTIPADAVVVIVDACRTGPVRSGGSRGASKGPAFDVTLVKDPAPTGHAWIASASKGEVAQESDDIEGAWFTHHVTAGLRGAADADDNGEVTLDELYRHAHARTVAQSFGGVAVQHPVVDLDLAGEGTLALTRLDRAAATLVLAAGLAGSFLVVDDRGGDVIVEVEKHSGRAVALAVPARRLRVQQREGSTLSVANVDVGRGARVVIDAGAFVAAPRLTARARGSDVDPSPWGVSAGIAVATAPAAAHWTTGIVLGVEHRLDAWPVFVRGSAVVLEGRGNDATRLYRERDVRAGMGLAVEQWTPVGRLSAGAQLGVQWLAQDITRTDETRLRAAGLGAAAHTSGFSIGPVAAAEFAYAVPVIGGVGMVVVVIPHVAGMVVDGGVDVGTGVILGTGVFGEW
jgi:hypothetical protein